MHLEAKFIKKCLRILGISGKMPGLMHEPFFAVCWAPAVLPKLKATNTSPHTRLEVMLQNLSWTSKRNGSFSMPGLSCSRYHARFTVGITQPHPSLEIHHMLLLCLAGRTHMVLSAEVIDVSLTHEEMSRFSTVGRRAPSQNILGRVSVLRQLLPMALSSKGAPNKRSTPLAYFVSLEHIYRDNKQMGIKLVV